MKYFVMVFILFSCSTSEEKRQLASDPLTGRSDEDLGWVKASDFNAPRLIKRKASGDAFASRAGDALSRESMARAPEGQRTGRSIAGEDGVSRVLDLCYKKKFDEAFSLVKQEHKQYAKHPGYWNAVGSCYVLRGEGKKALLFYQKAYEIDPRYTPAHNNMGVLYQREGKFKKAYDTYAAALKSNNFSSTPLFNMAQLDLKHGLLDRALGSFNALYRKDKGDVDVVNALGTIYLMKGDLKKSIAYYSQIGGNYYKRPDIGLNLAVALHLAENHDKAKALMRSISVRESSPMYAYAQRVRQFVMEGK